MTLELPPTAGRARDAAILRRVDAGDHDAIRWALVAASAAGHTALFHVFADALAMDGVRINVSARLAQQIADRLDCSLLTAKLADLTFLQRTAPLTPHLMPETTTTAGMVEESRRIDAELAPLLAAGASWNLVQTVGKHWLIDNALEHLMVDGAPGAMNYGWHFVGATFGGSKWEPAVTPGLRVVQGRGTKHNLDHVDYSQTCVLVAKACTVDGAPSDVGTVLSSKDLAPLASVQGVVRVLRQPGV